MNEIVNKNLIINFARFPILASEPLALLDKVFAVRGGQRVSAFLNISYQAHDVVDQVFLGRSERFGTWNSEHGAQLFAHVHQMPFADEELVELIEVLAGLRFDHSASGKIFFILFSNYLSLPYFGVFFSSFQRISEDFAPKTII